MGELEKLEELERREKLRWAFRLRRRLIIGLVFLYALSVVARLVTPRLTVLAFLLLFFAINEFREWLFRRRLAESVATRVLIVGEICAVVLAIYCSGGAESFLLPLSVLQIVGITVHVSYDFGWICAYVSTAAFSLVNILEFLGLAPHSPLFLSAPDGAAVYFRQTPIASGDPWRAFCYLVVATVGYGFTLSLTAYASGYINQKIKVREELLERAYSLQSAMWRLSDSLLGEFSVKSGAQILSTWMVHDLGYSSCVVELGLADNGFERTAHPPDFATDGELARLYSLRPANGEPAHTAGQQYLPLLRGEESLGWVVLGCAHRPGEEEMAILDTATNQFLSFLEKARSHQEIVKLSITDELTGIFNHRHFVAHLRQEVERARRYGQPAALLLMDLDHFKRVNDVYGHLAGDAVLKGLARRIQKSVRTTDLVARYGGEEFIVLAPQTDLGSAEMLAERLRHVVSESPLPADDRDLAVSISVGVAEVLVDRAQTDTDLMRIADSRLYRAKSAGRNRVIASSPDH
ncbi:MAG: GGDEF domain-containing protein [Candidatus Riflebacteria bacterium]|nr:GGDEF domain-containing protein [Candidatus Riflebacteria bacterium]